MNSLPRATALKIAAGISVFLSVINILVSLQFIIQGAAAVDQASAGPPYFVEMILFVTGIVGVVAAYGTWKQMRWGVILTIFVSILNVLNSAPGILFAPRPWGLIASSVALVLSIVIIALCLWRDRKPVTA